MAAAAGALWALAWLAAIGPALAVEPAEGAEGRLVVELTAHPWWWKVRYLSDEPSRILVTANEIHIPTGAEVEMRLLGSEVDQSLWLPALGGRILMSPGRPGRTFLRADAPGRYEARCTQRCTPGQGRMALQVVAEEPAAFRAWYDGQLRPAPNPASGEMAAAEATFRERCGACHAVRGTMADGILGPDLSHLMTRRTLAAGTLPNSPANLAGWIADPPHIKPGAWMPRLDLTGPELTQVRTYLEGLD